ncbi:MAG: transposase [Deltaproteobacteria bacterium]|nr:transposase [Deltaproteobacteria bacterium]
MAHRGPGHHGAQAQGAAVVGAEKKTPGGILRELERIIESARPAFKQERSLARGRRLALSQLLCLGRHTVTGLICASGRQFRDWSADYRLFSGERFDKDEVFTAIRREASDHLGEDEEVVCAMDDSLMRKSGRRIPGAGRLRDPLSPPFRVNLAWGLRFVQTSMIVPPRAKEAPGRAVPIDFVNAPVPKKPGKNSAPESREKYLAERERSNISRVGAERIRKLRRNLDGDERTAKKKLLMAVDNRFTNRKVFRSIPERTVLIGRLRHDARLYYLPEAEDRPGGKGRKKSYGERAPTPEAIRKDEAIPWQRVPVFAAGRMHEFKVKALSPLLWQPAGADKPLKLVVIAPLSYRPSKKSKVLYRMPAYLACTDPEVPLEKIVRAYVWRWEIEVNFRDEKQLLGLGEAQVWNKNSVNNDPAFVAATYAMLLLAGLKAFPHKNISIPPPKWRKKQKPRLSTQDLISQLRAELWGKAIGYDGNIEGEVQQQPEKYKEAPVADGNFRGFRENQAVAQNALKLYPHIPHAVLYATG